MSTRRLAYLCLETPREGQAVYTHVHETVNELRALGWDVELIATNAGGVSARGSFLGRGLDYLRAQIRLVSVLPRVDAVYVRAHFAALPASLVAWLWRKPVIQEINGLPADLAITYPWLRPLLPVISTLYVLQYRLATNIAAVTDGLNLWVRQVTRHDRVLTIPNGANTELFCADGPRAAANGSYVIFVGGLVAWHGIETMLAALDEPGWPVGVHLLVAGDGIERQRLAAGNKRLEWLGKKPYYEIPALLRGALAALCVVEDPDGRSSAGVAPLKLFEAMACGVPVIVTDLPFQADLVRQHQAGVVIPMAAPEALARAVAALAADPQAAQAMGARGARYVREHASWRARAEQTARLILDAINARR